MDSEPPPDENANRQDETTKPKPTVDRTQNTVDIQAQSAGEGEGEASARGTARTKDEMRRSTTDGSGDSNVLIRRKSSPRSSSAVKAEQVVADVEPVVQGYILHRAQLDELGQRVGADETEARLYRIFEAALLNGPTNETYEDEEDESSSEGQDYQSISRQSSVSTGSSFNSASVSDPDVTRRIGRELANLGDRFAFQERFHMPFEMTFKLMEERAALDGGGSVSLANVFREAVRRLLTNQPITWATLVTLLEFAYYVMRRFVTRLVRDFRNAVDKVVSRVRRLASAIVRYVRTADTGIVDWLVGEGGWNAALDLETLQSGSSADAVDGQATTNESARATASDSATSNTNRTSEPATGTTIETTSGSNTQPTGTSAAQADSGTRNALDDANRGNGMFGTVFAVGTVLIAAGVAYLFTHSGVAK